MHIVRRPPDTFLPDPSKTLHIIGDLHCGAMSQVRLSAAKADIRALLRPAAHIQVGDQTDQATASQDTKALDWLNALPNRWWAACGNHDIYQNTRTVAQWSAVYAMQQNYTLDLGFVQLVVVASDNITTVGVKEVDLSTATLTWLDTQLAAATKDCWVVCHGPLTSTVLSSASAYGSDESFFHVTSSGSTDSPLRTVLGNRSRAKVIISGHTHSPLDAAGLVKTETVGSRTIVSVNASSPYYTDRNDHSVGTSATLYLTQVNGGIEIRARDHGNQAWAAVGGKLITTVPTL